MNRRILINLAVFAALGVIMTWWAFNNVVRFDFIDQPYRLTAVFESSPGLHPNFEVDYLGTRVGKIDSVQLKNDKVIVKLDIDKGVKIPQGVSAQAARKSAVGEPVVELTPKPGQGKAPPLPAGSTITDTSVPPKYSDLFGSVNKVIRAIDPEDAKVLTHELALGWDGRAESLRQIITGGDQLTTTFASNSELLDGLTKDLGRITHVLAANRGDLGAGVDNLATLLNSLSQVRGEIAQLRDKTPDLLTRVNDLFDKMGPDFNCSLDTLGSFFPALATPTHLRELNDTLAIAPQLSFVLDNIIGEDEGQKVLNVTFMLTVKKLATLEYKYPLPQPKVGKIPNCPDGRAPGVSKQKPFTGRDPGSTIPTHDPRIQPKDVPISNAANRTQDTAAGPPAWLIYVPPVIALLVLIKVAAGSIPVLSRRRRGRD